MYHTPLVLRKCVSTVLRKFGDVQVIVAAKQHAPGQHAAVTCLFYRSPTTPRPIDGLDDIELRVTAGGTWRIMVLATHDEPDNQNVYVCAPRHDIKLIVMPKIPGEDARPYADPWALWDTVKADPAP